MDSMHESIQAGDGAHAGSTPKSNFAFLEACDPLLLRLGSLAERYFEEDPATSIFKLRQFGEVLARLVASRLGVPVAAGAPQVEVLNSLRAGGVNGEVIDVLHDIRRAGNAAGHEMTGDHRTALHHLRHAWHLGTWFRRITGDRSFRPAPFVPPPSPREATAALKSELARLRRELEMSRESLHLHQVVQQDAERLREQVEYWRGEAENRQARLSTESERLNQEIERLRERPETPSGADVHHFLQAVGTEVDLDEADTRHVVDQQLRDAGWEADSETITFASGARPQRGRNLAIAEWSTASGPADYVLFIGLIPVAVVEAKRKNRDVAGSIEQAKRYSRAFAIVGDQVDPGGPWGTYRIPFMFATNGRSYLAQLREQSGIWFLDGRRPDHHPRALDGWYSPEGLSGLLELDEAAADAQLLASSSHYLDLRPYQHEAIRAVEQAIVAGQRRALVAMATGTGKTRTCIGLLYRLLKARRFRRILFMVDRSALGEQAHNAFKDVRLEHHQTFHDIYEIKGMGDIRPDATTRLHVTTVQGMMRRILYPAEGEPMVPVDQYDLVVVDECHRGYTLDQEMSDAELTFRSDADYRSKYRTVLDHFDAVKVGLTATPALHTVEIFGAPVYEYAYRQAVIDGFLIDHEPPYRIVTALGEDGMHWDAQAEVQVYSVQTQRIETVFLPDEVHLELEAYNRKVLTDNFNRTVCGALAPYLDPDSEEKTLVFCVNDKHADKVVTLLKEALDAEHGGIADDAVVKITGLADQPGQKIRCFKNERLPQVAVTVDLLTTGIDVPEIANLVFLRRVNSRILYEQMLGRATRLCPRIQKERFRIFDAVDLYDALQDQSDMKPVVARPDMSLGEMVADLVAVTDASVRQTILDQIVARLQRKKRVLNHRAEHFEAVAGTTIEGLIQLLRQGSGAEAASWFQAHQDVSRFVDEVTGPGTKFLISEHPDELRRIERGYGAAQKPEDYLESFARFVRDHLNQIPALVAVTQRPRDLTRKELRALQVELDRARFNETALRSAWREVRNEDIAATIVGFIRQAALGSPLVPYAERVDRGVKRILSGGTWTSGQRKWLERIGRQLKQETVVDRESLDRDPFLQHGGYSRVNREFGGRLDTLLGDLQDAIWSDPLSA